MQGVAAPSSQECGGKFQQKLETVTGRGSNEVVISEGVTKAISGVFVVSGLAECVII